MAENHTEVYERKNYLGCGDKREWKYIHMYRVALNGNTFWIIPTKKKREYSWCQEFEVTENYWDCSISSFLYNNQDSLKLT